MAVRFLGREVSDLCLGKPPLRSLSIASTVADALSAIKTSGEIYVSVWSCDCDHHRQSSRPATNKPADFVSDCRCIGKICMVDVICFLCRDDNVSRPFDALRSPVSDLIPKGLDLVAHLEPHSSLAEAIDHLLEGVQNLVIPIQSYTRTNSRKKILKKTSSFGTTFHNGQEFCWLAQEDVVRSLLDSIGVFSPLPAFTIESLNIIDMDSMTVHYNDPASSALVSISRSRLEQTCVAVVDEDKRLVGEISPYALASCDETVAAAIMTLSAGDLMAYIDCCGPPDDLVDLVKTRLQEKNLSAMLDLMEEFSLSSASSSSSCSSDEEFGSSRRSGSGRISMGRRSEAIVCHPWNSLMAVMIQMIAHRVNYAWVVEQDYTLIGIVTFAEILRVFRSMAGAQRNPKERNLKKQ